MSKNSNVPPYYGILATPMHETAAKSMVSITTNPNIIIIVYLLLLNIINRSSVVHSMTHDKYISRPSIA